jgi:hypothetical protein
MRECSPGLRSHLRSHLRSQSLPSGHAVDQPKDLQRTARGERLTRNQLSLALPRPAPRRANTDVKPPLTSANAAQPSLRTLSWQLVLTRRQASPKLTNSALTWGWAQQVSNLCPLANPKIGELASARQPRRSVSGAGLGRAGTQAAGSRVTV